MVLTTSSLFLHTLAQVGITHVFVNWGSDHPAMLEELERQRATHGNHALTIVTSPNEMVALSAAQGYAQVTGNIFVLHTSECFLDGKAPFLTIVLNNGGHGSNAVGDQLTVGFGPDCPDYSQIAVAASSGWAWGRKISVSQATDGMSAQELLHRTIVEAVRIVVEERRVRCAVVDCVIEII